MNAHQIVDIKKESFYYGIGHYMKKRRKVLWKILLLIFLLLSLILVIISFKSIKSVFIRPKATQEGCQNCPTDVENVKRGRQKAKEEREELTGNKTSSSVPRAIVPTEVPGMSPGPALTPISSPNNNSKPYSYYDWSNFWRRIEQYFPVKH